ncbi:hypothetical protein VXN63_06660 [Marinilactibacillus sp. XAAS-LB27]|uniref:hypothetical protein n=1 Tax=Marinilactibacillus sp. XAAS-LB27 TaxID=3114538 RepID=UPI002E1706DA|nr:hypothetical protein [Marinilactibacillus sp. XAAS-LB27]
MRKLLLFSTSILLLAACGNTETDETNEIESEETSEIVESNQDQEEADADTEDAENGEESSENLDTEPSDESNQEENEMTEEEAEELVITYINEQDGPTEAESYNFGMKDEGEVYTASMYTSVSTDETKGAPIISMHEINKTTSEVKK